MSWMKTQWINGLLFALLLFLGAEMILNQGLVFSLNWQVLVAIVGMSFLLGILLVIPIGGADMPVVIALLNSYSGLAACAAGFVIENNVLIVAGALVGCEQRGWTEQHHPQQW